MHFGTSAHALYAFIAVLVLAFLASASGLKPVAVFLFGLLANYVLFIASVDGFSDIESFKMSASWGILVIIPVALGCAIATGVGTLVSHLIRGQGGRAKDAANSGTDNV